MGSLVTTGLVLVLSAAMFSFLAYATAVMYKALSKGVSPPRLSGLLFWLGIALLAIGGFGLMITVNMSVFATQVTVGFALVGCIFLAAAAVRARRRLA